MISAMKSNGVRTIVLVGPIGKGKSATGNSIIGRKVFNSSKSSIGVTTTCELQQAVLKDGQIINVIDTPGVNVSAGSGFSGNEFVKCMNMAKDGIHAFLLVFSLLARFTEEQATVIRILQNTYGSKIVDYMIVVFAGGDQLEDEGRTLDDYLGGNCPQPLKEILALCKDRKMLFNNRTRDQYKKGQQVQQLLSLVDMVTAQNGGQPYTNELLSALQIEARFKVRTSGLEQQLAGERDARAQVEGSLESFKNKSNNEIERLRKNFETNKQETKEQIHQANEEKQRQLIDMIERKCKETTSGLEQLLDKERAERLKVEETIQSTQKKTNDEIFALKVNVENGKQETKELLKVTCQEMKEQMSSLYEEQQKRTDKVDSKLNEKTTQLEQLLDKERAERLKVEESIQSTQKKTNDEISALKDNVEKGKQETKELLKVTCQEMKEQMNSSYEEQQKRTDKVDSKLNEKTTQLEQQLVEEQAARVKVEEAAQLAEKKSNDEICRLRETLAKAQKDIEELPEKMREKSCPIL